MKCGYSENYYFHWGFSLFSALFLNKQTNKQTNKQKTKNPSKTLCFLIITLENTENVQTKLKINHYW